MLMSVFALASSRSGQLFASRTNPLSDTPPHQDKSSHSSDEQCKDSASRALSVTCDEIH